MSRYQPYIEPDCFMDSRWPTSTIRAQYLDDARDILNKLADKAESYGQQITWMEHPFDRQVRRLRWDGKPIMVTEKWVSLFVDGTAPRYGDFKFVAMLERLKGGVIVKSIPDVEIGEYGQDWNGSCDHCGSTRARVHGYVIEDPNGRKIVGKSCVRDYLGMDNPQMMLRVLQEVTALSNMGDEEEGFGRGGVWSTEVWGVVAAASAAVALFGYGKADMDELSTKSRVQKLMSSAPPKGDEEKKLKAEMDTRGDHYYDLARATIDWARNLDPKGSDYLNNVKVILSSDYIGAKHLGVAVSAASAYQQHLARLQRIEDAKNGVSASTGHVGVLKKRMEADVTVERIIAINNQWGNYRIFIFRTTDGANMKWTTSNDTDTMVGDRPLNQGDKVRLAFTPQKHDMYQDQPQTVVNRCKIG